MANQTATTARDALCNNIGTAMINGSLDVRSGAQPTNCAASRTGTLGVSIPLGSSPFTTASGTGVLSLAASHTAAATALITAGYGSFMTSAAVCQWQGTIGPTTTASTSAATAANGDVLTFASAPSGIVVGQRVSGTGIPAGTLVAAIVGATIVMSQASTAGVASAATITFSFDMTIDNASLAIGQNVTVSSFTYTPGDA